MERNIFVDMEFVRRAPQPEEKRINREEFQAAVHAAVENIMNDPKIEGMGKILVPMVGMTFAGQMEEILFGKKEG